MSVTGRNRTSSIIACIAAMMSMTITLGLSWPLLAIVLEHQGIPPWLNGLSASSQMLAVLAIMPVAPRLIGRFGVVRAIGTGVLGMAGCLLLLPMFPNVWAWFPIRFALGLCTELVFVAGDIWINQLAEEKTRGRLIGIYGMFLHSGFALGPLAIMSLGSEDWTVLYLGVAVVLMGLLPLSIAVAPPAAEDDHVQGGLLHYLRITPTLIVAGLMFGLIESSTESLLLVFGLERGLDEDAAALLLSLFILGAVLGQLPSGWLADHVDHLRVLMGACLGTMLSLIALPLAVGIPHFAWPTMVVMGACMGSFYVVAMTMMGRRYRGSELIAVNTSFVFSWGVGGAIGPGLSGGAMTLFGPNGMPGVAALLCAGFLGVCIRQSRSPTR
jgi:MFS family permease